MSDAESSTPQVQVKRCKECGEVKALEAFSTNGKWGYKPACKPCHSRIVNEVARAKRREQRIERKRLEAIAKANAIPPVDKVCGHCKSRKPLSEFWVDRSQPDQLCSSCKSCLKEYAGRNRGRIIERSRTYYKANRLLDNERCRQWRNKNRDRKRQMDKQYRNKNLERAKANSREYLKKNRDKVYASLFARRTRKLGLPTNFLASDMRYAKRYWKNSCAVCGGAFGLINKLHWDHWIPLANKACPGTIPTNMLPLCDDCNLTKSERVPHEWTENRFSKRKARKIIAEIEKFFMSTRKMNESSS